MGKPDTWCFQLMQRQHNLKDVPLSKFLMVGDNLSTDVLFGNKCGIDTLLVLSGVTTAQKAERTLEQSRLGLLNSNPELDLEGTPTHIQSLFA